MICLLTVIFKKTKLGKSKPRNCLVGGRFEGKPQSAASHVCPYIGTDGKETIKRFSLYVSSSLPNKIVFPERNHMNEEFCLLECDTV
jgi:hypothetical protein